MLLKNHKMALLFSLGLLTVAPVHAGMPWLNFWPIASIKNYFKKPEKRVVWEDFRTNHLSKIKPNKQENDEIFFDELFETFESLKSGNSNKHGIRPSLFEKKLDGFDNDDSKANGALLNSGFFSTTLKDELDEASKNSTKTEYVTLVRELPDRGQLADGKTNRFFIFSEMRPDGKYTVSLRERCYYNRKDGKIWLDTPDDRRASVCGDITITTDGKVSQVVNFHYIPMLMSRKTILPKKSLLIAYGLETPNIVKSVLS